MTTNPKGYMKKYLRMLRRKLIKEFGGCCNKCTSTTKLEFAHIEHTGLYGMSRGKSKRLYDVIHNKHAYVLLCHTCHEDYDNK